MLSVDRYQNAFCGIIDAITEDVLSDSIKWWENGNPLNRAVLLRLKGPGM
jgi:hypothetical protein